MIFKAQGKQRLPETLVDSNENVGVHKHGWLVPVTQV